MKIPVKEGERSNYRWAVLFVSFYAFVAYAFAFQSVPPLFQSITVEFGISHVEAGLLMSIVLVPGIFLGLLAGLYVGKYGGRRVGFVSLLVAALGSIITATANSFPIILAGRLVLGIGGAFIITTTPAMIAQWFNRQELGKAMGIFSINMPFATVTAFPTASALMLAYGWRFPFYISAIIGVTAAAVFALAIHEGPFAKHENEKNVRRAIGNSEIWKVGLVWLFFNAAALSFTSWGPTLFIKFQNVPEVQASLLASLLMWSAIFFVPVFGYVSDKVNKRRRFAILGSFLMALTFVALAFTSDVTLVASVLALGIAAAMVPPVSSALPAEILGPALASVGFGITGICLNIGAAFGQPLVGFVLDMTNSYAICMVTIAVLSALGAIAAYTLNTN
jgi:MFS family permease